MIFSSWAVKWFPYILSYFCEIPDPQVHRSSVLSLKLYQQVLRYSWTHTEHSLNCLPISKLNCCLIQVLAFETFWLVKLMLKSLVFPHFGICVSALSLKQSVQLCFLRAGVKNSHSALGQLPAWCSPWTQSSVVTPTPYCAGEAEGSPCLSLPCTFYSSWILGETVTVPLLFS